VGGYGFTWTGIGALWELFVSQIGRMLPNIVVASVATYRDLTLIAIITSAATNLGKMDVHSDTLASYWVRNQNSSLILYS
jgi:hypothetical protein